MDYTLQEWLHLVIRWTHVFAAILWIGQTYFFTWLDGRLHAAEERGEVWMVHSGGFYVVHKQTRPELTRPLHWFRWEAAITWLSGVALFILVYFLGGILVTDASPLSLPEAIAVSVGSLVLAWMVYDILWSSALGRHELAGTVVSYLLLVGSTWGFMQLFSARAAYLQIGAILGTIMAANVWERILPAQKKLIAAAQAGEQPDEGLANAAKTRSKHNTFMVVPVVLIMISSHFPIATYGSRYNWIVLAALILVGWGAAGVIRKR